MVELTSHLRAAGKVQQALVEHDALIKVQEQQALALAAKG
ncbi:hypothetical protein PG5_00360 [Pseudomonas sp. G5(2012)]|nr:hypothetical protein PG5_00360 [Pseudomonas sp. G5(2012)]